MESSVNSLNELENRCLAFSLQVKSFCGSVPQDLIHQNYIAQLILSSASIGANYIEANEKIGENDLLHKIRIARKESKETIYWLHHFDQTNDRDFLIDEADQLRKIFSSMITKISMHQSQSNNIHN